eukprot:m51a1_g1280 hypothetical protein (586) ;mRNA; r:121545-127757
MAGFSVEPKRDCPHLRFLEDTEIPQISYPNSCSDCGDASENWLCLSCNETRCSRYVHGHASRHGAATGHPVAVSFADCSAWCYLCEDYVDHPALRPFITAVQTVKFRSPAPPAPARAPAAAAPAPAPAPAAAAPPAAVAALESLKKNAIEGKRDAELEVEGSDAGDLLAISECTGCVVHVRGSGLGALAMRSLRGCAVHVETSAAPPETSMERCQQTEVVFSSAPGNVYLAGCTEVALAMRSGWEALHTTACQRVTLQPPGGPVFRVRSSDEHIITQAARGQVVSEFAARRAEGDSSVAAPDDDEEPVAVPRRSRMLGHARPEDIEEHHDSPQEFESKMLIVARMVRDAAGDTVVYTGAGISTSASIPDYRGPKGVWTARDRGERVTMDISFEEAKPTRAHMAIAGLVREGLIKFVTSTNVDGLHVRSGLGPEHLAELHGNAFLEVCRACGARHMRFFDTTSIAGPHKTADKHSTGRDCDKCGKPLFDSIVHFGENLPRTEIESAARQAKCKLSLVLGTSMMRTKYDSLSAVRLFARTDEFMEKLCALLGVAIPEYMHFDKIIQAVWPPKFITFFAENPMVHKDL